MTGGVLVVGYGSLLRTDDGVGRIVAQRLVTDPRLDGATVIACHQLTPELALDLSRADFAVLIDASRDQAAGEFSLRALVPVAGRSSGSHHVDAAELVALAGTLYGRAPEVVTVSVGASSFELGEHLSPAVEAALPALVEAIVGLVAPYLAAGSASVAGAGNA